MSDLGELGARRLDLVARLSMRSRWLRERAANAGAVADYTSWCLDRFGAGGYVPRRTALWERVASGFPGPIRGVEFGVAHGFASAWWLDQLPVGSTWDGFDRFTGLPRAWRYLPAGEFDNGGSPPPIAGPGITWHVGDVADTITGLSLERDDRPWLVLFDLDIYEPSRVAWDHVGPSLRAGDVLYFDEAFDRDERHLLDHWVMTCGLEFEGVGWTPTALALRIV